MKHLFVSILFAICLNARAADISEKDVLISDLTVIVLCHRIEYQATTRKDGDGVLYFVRTSPAAESRVLGNFSYPWLKPAADFVTDRTGTYLRADPKIMGIALTVGYFEKTDAGFRCILSIASGPLGVASLRYYLKKENGSWAVEKVVRDRNLFKS
jgi:hypothetical protein